MSVNTELLPTCEVDKINPAWGSCDNEATLVAEVGHSMNGCSVTVAQAFCVRSTRPTTGTIREHNDSPVRARPSSR